MIEWVASVNGGRCGDETAMPQTWPVDIGSWEDSSRGRFGGNGAGCEAPMQDQVVKEKLKREFLELLLQILASPFQPIFHNNERNKNQGK